MRIHRLPLLLVLIVLALTTMTTITYSPIAVESGTAVAQQAVEGEAEEEPTEAEGVSTFPLTETKEERDYDLYLDAAEVERRAAEEQSGDRAVTSSGRLPPLSFKHVALPLAGGIDHAVAGVSTRNSGHGVIRLRGVPAGSQLIVALLVWGEITASPQVVYPVGFAPVCNSGTIYQGFMYGTTQQPCWNSSGVYAGYIANVTPAIPPPINGDYQIKGLNSFITNGSCPWKDGAIPPPSNQLPLSEGASLIVFYTNPLIPPTAQVYLHLGPQRFFGGHVVVHAIAPIPPGLLTAKHSRIGADGQVARNFGAQLPFIFDPSGGLRSNPPISDERTWINALQIKGDSAGLNRDSDWNGYDGEPSNKLWDTHTDAFNSNILAPPNYNVIYLSQGDCIVWAAHILGIK